MAQTNSVQREPSMEEILASIRRIIEDSDGARKTAESMDEAPAQNEPAGASVIEVEAFRADLRRQGVEARAPSLADIQAEVRHAGEDAAPARAEEQPRPEASPETAGSGGSDAAVPAEDEMLAELSLPVHAEDTREPPAAAEPRQAILSERAGRQVAAAFGELSEAFAASRRRSFDEMAEEMMRPMLQDWLDNNLPLLVERLVREEIERVARGVSG
jgi:cell pole-organizing protein PopZ